MLNKLLAIKLPMLMLGPYSPICTRLALFEKTLIIAIIKGLITMQVHGFRV